MSDKYNTLKSDRREIKVYLPDLLKDKSTKNNEDKEKPINLKKISFQKALPLQNKESVKSNNLDPSNLKNKSLLIKFENIIIKNENLNQEKNEIMKIRKRLDFYEKYNFFNEINISSKINSLKI